MRGVNARCRGNCRDHNVGATHCVGCRVGGAHADGVGRTLERFALGLREQNIPGRDAGNAVLAQTCGDRLTGFAEADETEGGFVVGHGGSL